MSGMEWGRAMSRYGNVVSVGVSADNITAMYHGGVLNSGFSK